MSAISVHKSPARSKARRHRDGSRCYCFDSSVWGILPEEDEELVRRHHPELADQLYPPDAAELARRERVQRERAGLPLRISEAEASRLAQTILDYADLFDPVLREAMHEGGAA